MAHRRSTSFARGPRRKTMWIGSADETGWTSLAAATVILDQAFTGAQVSAFAPFTIVRSVGQLAVKGDQFAADEQATMAMGGMVVREAARVGGVGNVPTPITEILDDGWFLYQIASASSSGVTGQPQSVY